MEQKETRQALRHSQERYRKLNEKLQVLNKELRARKEELRRVNASLAETHERAAWLARFPEENPNPVMAVTLDGTVLYANPAAVRAAEWECEVGKPLPKPLRRLVRTAMAKGRERQQDVQLGDRVYLVSVVPLAGQSRANIYARDITDRKHAEEELWKAKADLDRAQAVAHTGSWRLDVRRDDLLWSDETHRIFGIPKGTRMSYDTFLAAVHPDDRRFVDRAWMAALRGEPYDIEHRIVVGNTVKWVRERAELEFDAGGSLIGGFGTVQDVTERKEAREELERQRNMLTTVAANTQAHLLYLDRDFNFVWVNSAYAEACGRSQEELIGHNHFEFYPDEENQAIFERVRDTGETFAVKQKPYVFPDHPEWGTTYWGWTLTPIVNGEGTVTNLVFSLVDVTHDVLARQEIERLSAERELHAAEVEKLLARERRIADTLQRALGPPEIPTQIGNCRIAARYQPGLEEAEIGGDFYDVFHIDEDLYGILVGDVAGKGLSAAIHVAAARYSIRSHSMLDPRPAATLTHANEVLCRGEPAAQNLTTVFFGVLDANSGTLSYVNAGHEPPVVCNRCGFLEECQSTNIPLGVMPGVAYTGVTRGLKRGERIVIVTDGISEARTRENKLYSKERLREFLINQRELDAEELASALLDEVNEFAGGHTQDDVAIVVIDVE